MVTKAEIASTRRVIEQQREMYSTRMADAMKAGDRAAVEKAASSIEACKILLADLDQLEAELP